MSYRTFDVFKEDFMRKTHLAKSFIWLTISEIIFNLSGYVIHSAVGRILGPADYGRYGLVVTLTTMVIILIGNGIPTAMAKYISEIFETRPSLVKVIKRQAAILQAVLVGFITLLFFLLSPALAKILGDPSLTELFRISTLIIPSFALASFYFSYYTGLHKFKIQSFLKTFRSLVRVGIIIGLAYLYSVKGSVIGYAAAPLLVFAVAWSIDVFKVSRELEQKDVDLSRRSPALRDEGGFEWRKLTNYAGQIIVFFLAYELLISIDLYLVKALLKDDYITGIYNAALTVGRIPYYLFYALTIILLPAISKSTAEQDIKKTRLLITWSLRLMLWVLVPAVVLMSQFSSSIIDLFYGQDYMEAARSMSILVYGVGFLTVFYVMSFVMNGAGKTKISMSISIIGVAINTALNYIFIQKYGIVGSAIATSIASTIVTVIMLYYIYQNFQTFFSLRSIIKAFIGALIIYVIAHFLPQGRLVFVLWSAILGTVYLAVLYLLGEIKKEDLLVLKDIKKVKG